jgi:hypothetical protein
MSRYVRFVATVRATFLLALACAAMMAVAATASAETYEFSWSGESEDWTRGSAWTPTAPNGGPGENDKAVIPAGKRVILVGTTKVHELVVEPGGEVDFYGAKLTAASATLGSNGGGDEAVLESLSEHGELVTTGGLTLFGGQISKVNVHATGGGTRFESNAENPGETVTTSWSNSTLTVSGGTASFAGSGSYELAGLNPTIDTDLAVEGKVAIPGTLTLNGPSTITFSPSAAGSSSSPSMLTLGGLTTSGSDSVALASNGAYTPKTGDRVNLISAPAQGIEGLTATNTSTATFSTDQSGGRLYFTARAAATSAPPLTLGTPSPEHPLAGNSVTIPISTEAGASLSCTANGASASCSTSAITFTTPEAYSEEISVTATNSAGSTTRSVKVPIAWFPTFVNLSYSCEDDAIFCNQKAELSWPSEPRGAIECRRMFGAVEPEYFPGIWVSLLYAQDALGEYYPNALIACREGENAIVFSASALDSQTDVALIPTTYGWFLMFVSGTRGASAALLEELAGSSPALEPTGSLDLGPLTCPTHEGATGYLWTIESENAETGAKVTTLKAGQTLIANELPKDATVTCYAWGSGFWPASTVLVSEGVRTTASAAVATGASAAAARTAGAGARAARAKAKRKPVKTVRLTLKASGRERLEIRAYNTKTTGTGKSAKATYKLAYHEQISVKRGTKKIHFGNKLKTGGFQIIVRRVLKPKRGKRARYSRSLVVS